jgi:hypothetical protein
MWQLSEQPKDSRAVREIVIENLDNIQRDMFTGCVSSLIASCKKLTVLQLDMSCFPEELMDDLIEAVLESKETLEALRLNISRNPFAHPDPGENSDYSDPGLLFLPPYALCELCTFPKLQELSLCLKMGGRDLRSLDQVLPPNLVVLDITLRSPKVASLSEITDELAELVDNKAYLKVIVVSQTGLWRISSQKLWACCYLVDEEDRIEVVSSGAADIVVPGVGRLGDLRMDTRMSLGFTSVA